MLNQQAYFTTFTKLLAQVEDCCGQAADLNEENLFTVFAEKQKGEPIPPVDLIVADAAERSTLTKVSRGDPIQNRRSRRSIPQRQQDWHEPINNRQPVDKTSRGESECLSTRCHEIRTSLSGIKVMLELARMRNLEPKAAKPLDKARQFANHLLELINDFLDLSKIQSGKLEVRFQPFSLREVLRPCVGLFADKARDKGIDLNCTIGTDVPDRLCGDEGHLRRVLMNIVDNAVKFTDQGWVELRVERVSQKSPDGSTEIRFQVQDTGIGIALDRQTDIFESFEQVHSHQAQFGDTGLSLAISRHLVEIMGGEILVNSREGVGSTFSFTVKFKPAKTSSETSEARNAEQLPGRKLHILVAEDSKINQIYILDLLERLGHTAVLAETGREAIKKLTRNHFDVVLMDVCMPDMDGAEATRVIRSQPPEGVDPGIPVIALTAYALQEEMDHYLQSGFNAYLIKPIDIEDLSLTLSRLIPNDLAKRVVSVEKTP